MLETSKDIHLNHHDGEPIFRIGVIEGQEYIDFHVYGTFSIMDSSDKVMFSAIKSDMKWRVKLKESKIGNEKFRLILYETFDAKRIETKLKIAQKFDPDAKIEVLGGNIFLNEKKINNNTKYVIIAGTYDTELDARKDFKKFKSEFNPTVIKDTVHEPKGSLEFFDAEYENAGEAKNYFKIVPDDV